MLDFNHSLDNLHSMDDLNFTKFLIERVMGAASYCCFRKFAFR